MKMTSGRITHGDVKKQMSTRGKASPAKEDKAKIPEGKTVSGKPEKFGGKQFPPFGKKGAAEEIGEPKMSKKANAKEEKAEK